MLYLSRLTLNPLRHEVQRDLADCHAMHERILSAFPDEAEIKAAREHFGVLYRVEPSNGATRVLVQSCQRPDWSKLPPGYLRGPALEPKRVDELYTCITTGQELVFRLRANPTRRISSRNTTQNVKWRGKRVDLRREEDQLAWLRRKGEMAGFALLEVRTKPGVTDLRMVQTGDRIRGCSDDQQLTFGMVTFDGRLIVTNAERFRCTLQLGIGPGKAFGFGLLSVAPVFAQGG